MPRGAPPALTLWILAGFALFGAVVPKAQAQCGGLCLYEIGSPDTGRAVTGASARAEDASTAFWNPAGMVRLEGMHIMVGTDLLVPNVDFFRRSGSTPGNDGGDFDKSVIPAGGSYFVAQVWDELRVGFSFNGLYGGDLDYDSEWVGRTMVTSVELLGLNLQPSVAYPITDWLSLGGGVNIAYLELDMQIRSGAELSAPSVKIRNASDWMFSGNVALLLQPLEGLRIGFYYRTPGKATLDGELDNPTPRNFEFDSKLKFAQGVNVSVFYQLTDDIALLGDGGWSDWSRFDWQALTVGNVRGGIPRGWKDTWRIGGGARYQLLENLKVQAGISYDSSPVSDSKRLPDLPMDRQIRYAAGLEFRPAENIVLNFGYEFVDAGRAEFDEVSLPDDTVIDGKMSPNQLHVVSIGLGVNF